MGIQPLTLSVDITVQHVLCLEFCRSSFLSHYRTHRDGYTFVPMAHNHQPVKCRSPYKIYHSTHYFPARVVFLGPLHSFLRHIGAGTNDTNMQGSHCWWRCALYHDTRHAATLSNQPTQLGYIVTYGGTSLDMGYLSFGQGVIP